MSAVLPGVTQGPRVLSSCGLPPQWVTALGWGAVLGGENRMQEAHELTLEGLSRSLPLLAHWPERGPCPHLTARGV